MDGFTKSGDENVDGRGFDIDIVLLVKTPTRGKRFCSLNDWLLVITPTTASEPRTFELRTTNFKLITLNSKLFTHSPKPCLNAHSRRLHE